MKVKIEFYCTFARNDYKKHHPWTDNEFQASCLENGISWESIDVNFNIEAFQKHLDNLKNYMHETHGTSYLEDNVDWMIWFALRRVDDLGRQIDLNDNLFYWYPESIRWEGIQKSIPMISSIFTAFKNNE